MFSRLCKLCRSGRHDSTFNQFMRYSYSPILPLGTEERGSDDADERITSKKRERVPLVICKRPEFNFYTGKTFAKFETIPIASQGWHHLKSAGDYFTILPDREAAEDEADGIDGELPHEFKDFCVRSKFIENLSALKIYQPTEIQCRAIFALSLRRHAVISAETGCGKTIAYLLPLLNQIAVWKKMPQEEMRRPNSPYGLIITPSRELAEQIWRVAKALTKDTGINIRVITGGRTKRISANPSVREIDLLIGSFGVTSKMTTTKIYKLNYVKHLVLDEAHALFDDTFDQKLGIFLRRMNFDPELVSDDSSFPQNCQMTLVSATKPSEMPEYMNSIVETSSFIDIRTCNVHRIMVPQKFMRIAAIDKPMALLKLVKARAMKKHKFIIFSNDSSTCDWISLFLNEFGVRTIQLNGEMPMEIRKGKFRSFCNGEYAVLSTTNAGARGLDTVNVNDIINYDFPMETADYIHRSGRTGRLGTKGECKVTNLISRPLEIELTQKIERAARRRRSLPIFDMLEENAKSMEHNASQNPVQLRKKRREAARERQRIISKIMAKNSRITAKDLYA